MREITARVALFTYSCTRTGHCLYRNRIVSWFTYCITSCWPWKPLKMTAAMRLMMKMIWIYVIGYISDALHHHTEPSMKTPSLYFVYFLIKKRHGKMVLIIIKPFFPSVIHTSLIDTYVEDKTSRKDEWRNIWLTFYCKFKWSCFWDLHHVTVYPTFCTWHTLLSKTRLNYWWYEKNHTFFVQTIWN